MLHPARRDSSMLITASVSHMMKCARWRTALLKRCFASAASRLMCGSALRFRSDHNEFGGSAPQSGLAQIKRCEFAGRPKAFRTSAGKAEDFLGKAVANLRVPEIK